MIIFFIIFMASLALFNFRVIRNIGYPPLFFSLLWGFLLLGIYASGDFFYPISDVTLSLYSLGVFMFSLGGLLVYSIYQRKPQNRLSTYPQYKSYTDRFFNISLIILLLALPFYWRHLQQLGTTMGIEDFWVGLRAQTSSGERDAEGFGIYAYFAAFSTFISLAAYYENDGTLKQSLRTYALIAVSLTFHILTASRLGAMMTIFGLVGIALVRHGAIRFRSILIIIFVFVLIFSVPAVMLSKGGSVENSIEENAISITESLKVYTLGGLVAMNDVVINGDSVESNWRSLRFFTTIANRLGSNFDLPSSNLDYTLTPEPTNVYTIYFPYYQDYGWFGTALIMFVMGSLTTWIYILAINGDPQASVLYGLIFSSLMLTCASEPFMTSISYWIQAFLITYILFKLPSHLGWKSQGLRQAEYGGNQAT